MLSPPSLPEQKKEAQTGSMLSSLPELGSVPAGRGQAGTGDMGQGTRDIPWHPQRPGGCSAPSSGLFLLPKAGLGEGMGTWEIPWRPGGCSLPGSGPFLLPKARLAHGTWDMGHPLASRASWGMLMARLRLPGAGFVRPGSSHNARLDVLVCHLLVVIGAAARRMHGGGGHGVEREDEFLSVAHARRLRVIPRDACGTGERWSAAPRGSSGEGEQHPSNAGWG